LNTTLKESVPASPVIAVETAARAATLTKERLTRKINERFFQLVARASFSRILRYSKG
jgi:hypothetical protein